MRISPWLVASFLINASLVSVPAVVPDNIACFVDLETNFFQEPIVNQGLSLYNVRQELWLQINNRLKYKSTEVPDRMKKKTAYMVPNPIEYPMQKKIAGKILKEVLFDVFLESVQEYWPIERDQAILAFDYIFSQQSSQFVSCFGGEAD